MNVAEKQVKNETTPSPCNNNQETQKIQEILAMQEQIQQIKDGKNQSWKLDNFQM